MKPNWKKEPNPGIWDPPIIKRWDLGVCTVEVEKLANGFRTVSLWTDNNWTADTSSVCAKAGVNKVAIHLVKEWFNGLPPPLEVCSRD